MRIDFFPANNDNRRLREHARCWQKFRKRLGVHDHPARLTIFEVMNVIGGARERIYRHGHGADFCGAKKCGNEFRRIRKHDHNAIAARNTLREQRIPCAIGERGEFAISYFVWIGVTQRSRELHHTGRIRSLSMRNSFFADIFSPYFRVLSHIFGEHLDALVRMGVEHFCAIFTQPIDAAAKILRFADDYGADAKLADQAAAIPAGSESGHHDFVAVTSLPARFAKSIGLAMCGGIAFLHSAIVAAAQEFSIAFE